MMKNVYTFLSTFTLQCTLNGQTWTKYKKIKFQFWLVSLILRGLEVSNSTHSKIRFNKFEKRVRGHYFISVGCLLSRSINSLTKDLVWNYLTFVNPKSYSPTVTEVALKAVVHMQFVTLIQFESTHKLQVSLTGIALPAILHYF